MEELTRNLASLEFASPLYFWIGGAVIFLLIFLPGLKRKKSLKLDLGYWNKRVKLVGKKTLVIPALVAINSILISLALANPQIVEKRSIPLYGKPVMVVMDISGSVMGEHSQFEQMREVFYDITKRDLGVAFGLLIYSSESYVARDFAPKVAFLTDTLENDEEISQISGGTRTDEALDKARVFFKKAQAEKGIIILFSDLEDNLGAVGRALGENLESGAKVYVIVAAETPQKTSQKIRELEMVLAGKKVKMVWVRDGEDINQICQELSRMDSSLSGQREIISKKSLAPLFLPAVLGLTILSVALSETIFRKIP